MCFHVSSSTYLRNEDLVALLNTHSYPLALAIQSTGTDGQDLGLVQLLDGGLGQEDAAGGLGLGLDALDEDTVEERGEGADGLESGRLQEFVSRVSGSTGEGVGEKGIGLRPCFCSCEVGDGRWERCAYHCEVWGK